MPGSENEAVVARTALLENVTVPGPLTLDQVIVKAPGGFGMPSSEAEPIKVAESGR